MNREIKFRAWDKQEGMVYWDFLYTEQVKNFASGKIPWDVNKIMQYTGLRDKNGKEIYEGDVVKHDLWGIHVISWDDISAGFRAVSPNGVSDLNMGHAQLPRIKIIGNIYENPDLLALQSKGDGI